MGYRKLGLNTGHRQAMLRNLVTSLFRHKRIQTTQASGQGGKNNCRSHSYAGQARGSCGQTSGPSLYLR